MSLSDWFGPEKSTAAWAAKLFKGLSKEDWNYAMDNQQELFKEMLRWRQGTPSAVLQGVEDGSIDSLSRLCTAILVSEAIQVNPNDIPQMEKKMKGMLLKKGIPNDLC